MPLVARNSGAWQVSLIFWAVVLIVSSVGPHHYDSIHCMSICTAFITVLFYFILFLLYIFSVHCTWCIFVFYNHCCLVRINKWMDGWIGLRYRNIMTICMCTSTVRKFQKSYTNCQFGKMTFIVVEDGNIALFLS